MWFTSNFPGVWLMDFHSLYHNYELVWFITLWNEKLKHVWHLHFILDLSHFIVTQFHIVVLWFLTCMNINRMGNVLNDLNTCIFKYLGKSLIRVICPEKTIFLQKWKLLPCHCVLWKFRVKKDHPLKRISALLKFLQVIKNVLLFHPVYFQHTKCLFFPPDDSDYCLFLIGHGNWSLSTEHCKVSIKNPLFQTITQKDTRTPIFISTMHNSQDKEAT